jgi:uncharacterized protein (DUF983 family)
VTVVKVEVLKKVLVIVSVELGLWVVVIVVVPVKVVVTVVNTDEVVETKPLLLVRLC